MLEEPDLDEVARAIFSVRTSEKPEFEILLVRAGPRAVKPLLRAIVFVTARQKDNTKHLAQSGKRSLLGEVEARYMWAKVALEPIIDDALKIVNVIGQPAAVELCSNLLDPERKIRIGACLILCKGTFVSDEVRTAAQNTINAIGPDKKEGITLMLLGAIMAKNGDLRWRSFIDDSARKDGISFERWVEKTINTGLIELQSYK